MKHDIHRRVARDSEGRRWLWIITQDSTGYHVCVWKLRAKDVAFVEDWERQATLRHAHGLPELPVPEDRLSNPVPQTLTVQDLDGARALLSRDNEPGLAWHVDEFFHAIDATRYSPGRGRAWFAFLVRSEWRRRSRFSRFVRCPVCDGLDFFCDH